jgi:DNA-directed RNA polymerase subunit RPC12/RpoP
VDECRECDCTMNSPCDGGCVWVAPLLCSSCLPYDIDYRCRDCGHEFSVTVEEDASIVVDGEEYEYSLLISCPGCDSNNTIDTELEEAIQQ